MLVCHVPEVVIEHTLDVLVIFFDFDQGFHFCIEALHDVGFNFGLDE